MEGFEVDTDLSTQSLLLAAANHDVAALRDLLRNTSANVQDEDTGFTPLHAAIAAFEPDTTESHHDGQQQPEQQPDQQSQQDQPAAEQQQHQQQEGEQHTNGHTNGAAAHDADKKDDAETRAAELAKAAETVKLLLANGAIWNDLDHAGETPGCIAHRLGLADLYNLLVDAGVRAELLLGRLDEYQILGEEDDDDEEDEEMVEGEDEVQGPVQEADGFEVVQEELVGGNGASAAAADSAGAAAGIAESLASSGVVVEAEVEKPGAAGEEEELANEQVKSEGYLASELTFTGDRLLDSDRNGVMMAWETSLMRRSAELLLPAPGLRVLNVGHGMGIIDGIIQDKAPAEHHIIEAHPAVAKRMRDEGWAGRKGVTVHEGRWQDVVPRLVEQNLTFDAIYFDTFAEEYKALREFFSEYVIGLLDPDGRFGFFNGLGADRKICYDVYTKIVEMDLFEAGFDTEWEEIPIPDLDANGEWEGVRRKYWVLDTYRLPTCKFIG